MTENEVLKDLQNYQGILRAKARINASVNPEIALNAITEAIDVIQSYRAIGTVEEFKALKEKNEQIPIIHGKAELELHDKGIRNKVIDEFAEKFIFKAVCEGCSGCCNCHEEGRQSECEDWKAYMEIAEEMRGAE